MKALLISDQEYLTNTWRRIKDFTSKFFEQKGYELEMTELKSENITFCMGCFGCWIKKPGECVINDGMAQINQKIMNSDAVIYLSPIIFGQFSPTLKNVIDRGLPNMLPFFEKRPDGSSMHPPRYETYPSQIIIGYGDEISSEDKQLFSDITKKHRRSIEVLICEEPLESTIQALNNLALGRVGGLL